MSLLSFIKNLNIEGVKMNLPSLFTNGEEMNTQLILDSLKNGQIPSPAELNSLLQGKNQREVKNIAQQVAHAIGGKIEAISEKIKDAKELTTKAGKVKSDWSNRLSFGIFGKSATDKRSELNTEVNIQQNEAIIEMNDLIQGSIALTSCSIFFAETMVQELSLIMVSGFQDQYGNAVELSEDAKEKAQMLITQAKKTLEHHQKINENAKAIEAIKGDVSQNTQNIDKNKHSINKNAQNIDSNMQNIDKNAQKIDKNAQSIELLQKEFAKASNSKIKISLCMSVLAILLSLVNLCLHFKLF